jgi:hypothetical protein
MAGVSIQNKEPIFPSCLRLGVEVEMLQPVRCNVPIRPAIIRHTENGLLIRLGIYLGLLDALSLEDDEGREKVAIGATALNYRHTLFIARLYRKTLLFCDRRKHFDIISNTFHEAFLIHVVLVFV